MTRLDKFISERTSYTRSQIKQMCSQGKITADGKTVRKSDLKIDEQSAEIKVCGNVVSSQRYKYILLNKPEGYVCSTSEKDGRNVMELIPDELINKNMFPAGRLDKDSLGALLITDDGELAHNILSPARHIPKIYIVKLDEDFKIKYIDLFKNGIKLSSGEICMPAKVRAVKNTENMAFIELHEGKYHQIKRMFSAVGNHVEKLMRVSLGNLILPEKLAVGDCMELLHKDVENLFHSPDFDIFCEDFSEIFSANLINNLP